jgi:hypothetical protein
MEISCFEVREDWIRIDIQPKMPDLEQINMDPKHWLQLLNTKESSVPWIAVGVLGDVDVVRTHVGIQVFQSEPRSKNVLKKIVQKFPTMVQ